MWCPADQIERWTYAQFKCRDEINAFIDSPECKDTEFLDDLPDVNHPTYLQWCNYLSPEQFQLQHEGDAKLLLKKMSHRVEGEMRVLQSRWSVVDDPHSSTLWRNQFAQCRRAYNILTHLHKFRRGQERLPPRGDKGVRPAGDQFFDDSTHTQ